MTQYVIPLNASAPYQEFTVNVAGRQFFFRLRWLALYKFFVVDIYENNEPLTFGRGLHPGVNLLKIPVSFNKSRLFLEGATPTLNNLGSANRLIYEVAE